MCYLGRKQITCPRVQDPWHFYLKLLRWKDLRPGVWILLGCGESCSRAAQEGLACPYPPPLLALSALVSSPML